MLRVRGRRDRGKISLVAVSRGNEVSREMEKNRGSVSYSSALW
jgi:hypothetical protein